MFSQSSKKDRQIDSMISLREWNTLETYVEEKIKLSCDRVDIEDSESSHGILHYACTHRDIPLSTVKAILKLYPCAISEADRDGRLPLHYALRNGVGSDVVEHLLEEFPESAVCQDKNGRTSLHLACKYFTAAYDKNSYRFIRREDRFAYMCEKLNMVMVMFLKADPECFLMDDNKGMSALEYLIEEEVAYKTFFMMNKTIELMRKMNRISDSQHVEEFSRTLQTDDKKAEEPEKNTTYTSAT